MRTLRLLRSVADSPIAAAPLIVVLPPRAVRLRQSAGTRLQCVVNPVPALGLSTSVRRAVKAARCARAVLLVPVDLPRLERRDLVRLIARWRASPRRVVGCRVQGGVSIPLIVPLRHREWFAALNGDRGLKDQLARLPAGEVRLLDLPSAAADVDTPADLERARRCLRRRA